MIKVMHIFNLPIFHFDITIMEAKPRRVFLAAYRKRSHLQIGQLLISNHGESAYSGTSLSSYLHYRYGNIVTQKYPIRLPHKASLPAEYCGPETTLACFETHTIMTDDKVRGNHRTNDSCAHCTRCSRHAQIETFSNKLWCNFMVQILCVLMIWCRDESFKGVL